MSRQLLEILNRCSDEPALLEALLRSQLSINHCDRTDQSTLSITSSSTDANTIWLNVLRLASAARSLEWLEIWGEGQQRCPLYKAKFATILRLSLVATSTTPSTPKKEFTMLQDLDNELFHWAKAEHYRGCMICPSHFEDMWWANFVDWWGDCVDLSDEQFATVEGAIAAAKARIDAEIATFIKEGVWSAIADLHELGVIHIPEA